MTRQRSFAGLIALAVFAAGCSSSTGTNTTAPVPNTDKPRDLGKVIIAQSVQTLSFAPTYLARAKGYFKEEGVEAEFIETNGGAEANAALVGKSVQFAAVDSGAVPQLVEKGADMVAIHSNVNFMTMGFVLRKETADKLGIKKEMSADQRLAKMKDLKGLNLGVTGAGAATDLYSRWYLKKAGLDPDKDVKLISLGGGAALTTALQQGQIDGFQLSPPVPESIEASGMGVILIHSGRGEVPELKFPYEVIITRKDYLQSNPEQTRAVARAVARANNFILEHPEEAAKLIQSYFGTIKPEILLAGLKSVATGIPKDGIMEKAGWENLSKIMLDSGLIKKAFDFTEGKHWTNEFIKDVKGQSDKK